MMKQCVSSVKAGILDGVGAIESSNDLHVEDGIAVISMVGPMMKAPSKFGGVSTVYTRQQVREAMGRDDVKQILMVVESGGGSVSGTKELGDDVRSANEKKPVTAYISDIGASAAYWVASQAGVIISNEMGQVGSIGVVAVVEDTSGMYEREGVKVHVVSTGSMKGAFADGAPITDEMLADLQEHVDAINVVFKRTVIEGRGIGADDLDAIADGRMFNAEKAKELGLIDGIDTLENVVANLKGKVILDDRNAKVSKRLGQSAKR